MSNMCQVTIDLFFKLHIHTSINTNVFLLYYTSRKYSVYLLLESVFTFFDSPSILFSKATAIVHSPPSGPSPPLPKYKYIIHEYLLYLLLKNNDIFIISFTNRIEQISFFFLVVILKVGVIRLHRVVDHVREILLRDVGNSVRICVRNFGQGIVYY